MSEDSYEKLTSNGDHIIIETFKFGPDKKDTSTGIEQIGGANTYRQYLMVELPCFVRSSTAALSMLGLPTVATTIGNGARASAFPENDFNSTTANTCNNENNSTAVNSSVSAIVNASKTLQFRFINDSDPFRHELQTHPHQHGAVARNGLLLKMRKNKRTGQVESIVVGGVSRGFSFGQPADYHFLPSNTGIVPMAASSGGTGSSTTGQEVLLETLPVSFCRSYVNKIQLLSMFDGLPLPYEKGTTNNKRNQPTDSNVDDPAEELGAEGEADDVQNYNMKRRRVRFITTPFVGFGKAVRTENPRGPVPTRWKNCPPTHKGIQMIALLKSIFEVIPILSKSQLVSMLDIQGHVYLFNDCLPFAAYSYTNGPFKGLWVRYGYDPTAAENSDSRIYQVINFRISTVVLHDLTKKALEYIGRDRSHNKYIDLDKMIVRNLTPTSQEYRAKPTYGHLPACIFGHMIKYMFSIQIYSFTDLDMLECARAAAVSMECSKISGWFLPHSLDGLRNLVLKIIATRFERFFATPVVFEEDEQKLQKDLFDDTTTSSSNNNNNNHHPNPEIAMNHRQHLSNQGDIILSRDVEHTSVAFMHNMSSCKAFPTISVVPVPMLRSFLEMDFTSLLQDGCWDSSKLLELVSRVAMDELGLPSSSIIVWMKVYRLLITMDLGALRSRSRALPPEEGKIEEDMTGGSKRTSKQKKIAGNERSASSSSKSSGLGYDVLSGSLMETTTTVECSSGSSSSSSSSSRLDALVNFGISYDSSISDVLLRQPSLQSHSRQHRQVGVHNNSSSSNTSSSLLLDFSNVQGYAVFGDDDDDDDDDDEREVEEEDEEDMYGRGEDDDDGDAENAYNDEYDE